MDMIIQKIKKNIIIVMDAILSMIIKVDQIKTTKYYAIVMIKKKRFLISY